MARFADNEQPGEAVSTDPVDLELARQIRALPAEIEPGRDLWPGVARSIARYPQRRAWNWSSVAVAASFLLAFSAFVLTLVDRAPETLRPAQLTMDESVRRMQEDYLQVRSPLEASFVETHRELGEGTLDELHRNLEIIRRANLELERLVREHPGNRRYVELLIRVQEQELELLNRDYGRETRAM